MTTKMIGIKEFRKNISKLWKTGREKEICYIVMYHAMPIFEVTPIKEKEFILEKIKEEVATAREQIKRGDVYTEKQVRTLLGL